MKIIHEFPIYDAGKYLGMLFGYEDGTWSHSLLNHGMPRLPSTEAATHDFWDTKLRLPAAVHRAIFAA